jgi:hypothetical protein
MGFLATALFFAITAAIVLVWRRLFSAVPGRIILILWAAVCLYQAETLFTGKVDMPGRLLFHAYPWKSLGREPVRANTGTTMTVLIPWVETARETLRSGELPLWNRRLGCGAPLVLAQQSGIFHPFFLAGLVLPIGKAWTLSVALRLWCTLFFTYVLLKKWDLRDAAALFGALAYGFSTFQVVWLATQVGLTVATMPLCLLGVDEILRRPRIASFSLLTLGLGMTLLGGHPETAFFVILVTAAYAIYGALILRTGEPRLLLTAAAALSAALLTSFIWYPLLSLLPLTERFHVMSVLQETPPEHHLGLRWLATLVSPNLLGTSPGGTYRPPEPRSLDLLDDYGEVASGYAGLATLALAFAALPLAGRRAPAGFCLGLMVVVLLTIMEAPGWHSFVRELPLFGLALHQRLRFVWCFAAAVLAALTLDAYLGGALPRRRIALTAGLAAAAAIGFILSGLAPLRARGLSGFEFVQIAEPVLVLLAVAALLCTMRDRTAAVALATGLTFCELVLVTWRYNPAVAPADVFPETGAIRAMRAGGDPHRMLALGWSMLPDTPQFYGLEDVKTTDPLASSDYLRLFRGYFAIGSDFEQVVHEIGYPITDYLNIRYFYAPPGELPARGGVVPVYRGGDGVVYRNERSLPRYFMPTRVQVEPSFEMAVGKLKLIRDFRDDAIVDHIPVKIERMAPHFAEAARIFPVPLPGGEIKVVRYGANETELDVDGAGPGFNLVVSSDTWWPGWRAYWNGRRINPVRVNGAFVGAFVPAGKGTLRLRYAPTEVRDGFRAAGATAILLAMAAFVVKLRERNRRGR